MTDEGPSTSVNAVDRVVVGRKLACRVNDVPLIRCTEELWLAGAANGWGEHGSWHLLPACALASNERRVDADTLRVDLHVAKALQQLIPA